VGDVSPWGKQFLNEMIESDVLDVVYEPNVLRFANALAPQAESKIFFVENFPESRSWMMTLIQSKGPFYLIWYGRTFTKEDLKFALDNRIYAVLENPKLEDKRMLEILQRLAVNQDTRSRQEHLVRSMKSILVQAEMEETAGDLVNELKTAISKLEQCQTVNEFNHASKNPLEESEDSLPFYKAQEFGDAMLTIEDLERTGVLWVRGSQPHQEGKVEFSHGRVFAAVAGEAHGLKAIYRMFLWDEPRFLFSRRDSQGATPEQDMDFNLKTVVREGQNHRQRYQKIRKELPPNDIVLALEPASLHPDTGLMPPDFATLATLLEFGKVGEILDYSSLPDIQVYESLIRLKKERFIRVTGFPSHR
jgi:hypothetical protein